MTNTGIIREKIDTIFICAILYGLIIRMYPDGRSLWLDELGSLTISYRWNSFHEMFRNALVYEVNPPLYEIILHYWTGLFGYSDYVVRAPSMLFGIALVGITYLYGRTLFRKRDASVLTALLAVSWGGIYYAHEARSYSLLLLLSTILMLKSLKLITMNNEFSFRDMAEISVVGFLICYAHYFGALLYFSNLVILMVFLNSSRGKILFLSFLSMTAFAPWLIINVNHMTTEIASWYSSTLLSHVAGGFLNMLTADKYVFFGLVILILYRIFFHFPNFLVIVKSRRFYYLMSVISLALTISVLIHFLYKPIITYRNLIILLPYSYAAISILFSDSDDNKQRMRGKPYKTPFVYLSAGLVIVMMFSSFINFVTYQKQDWRGAADSIKLIKNVDKIFCVGNRHKYWHYLRGSDVQTEQLINVRNVGINGISRPDNGLVSVLWVSHYASRYFSLKKELTEKNFHIIEEHYVSGSRDDPFNFSAYLIFR
jgi:uncharacterized membrane protein